MVLSYALTWNVTKIPQMLSNCTIVGIQKWRIAPLPCLTFELWAFSGGAFDNIPKSWIMRSQRPLGYKDTVAINIVKSKSFYLQRGNEVRRVSHYWRTNKRAGVRMQFNSLPSSYSINILTHPLPMSWVLMEWTLAPFCPHVYHLTCSYWILINETSTWGYFE